MRAVHRRVLLAVIALGGILAIGVAATGLVEDDETDQPRVTVVDDNDAVLGTVEVRIADTLHERYRGLSDTESLGPNEGMLFVHETEGTYTYVMRNMAFPIDIVFIDSNQTITAIHHAEVEERPLTKYTGRAKWVLEIPYRWTVRHGVQIGHRVRITGA